MINLTVTLFGVKLNMKVRQSFWFNAFTMIAFTWFYHLLAISTISLILIWIFEINFMWGIAALVAIGLLKKLWID